MTALPRISPARKAAFNVLLAVEHGKAHADDLLRSKAVDALSPADRHLATTLVLGVLRWQILLDDQLKLLTKTRKNLDPEVSIALRMGAFQLRFLDRIPVHAAIDESVELTKQSGHRFASGLVNAVLRKLAAANSNPAASALKEHDARRADKSAVAPVSRPAGTAASKPPVVSQLEHQVSGHDAASRANKPVVAPVSRPAGTAASKPPAVRRHEHEVSGHGFSRAEGEEIIEGALAPEGTAADLTLAYAHPAWLVERWARFYGLEATRAICRHGQAQPLRTIRLVSSAAETELNDAGIILDPASILAAARTVASGDITATAAFREGRVRLQDEGSQLIAELAACSTDLDQKVRSIGDTCAAPGGKTLILAERNPDAHILACESSPTRLAELSERLAAYSDRIECRLADATALNEDSAFDLVLADVPCSGTGTLGRNPEIRHRLRPDDLQRHADRQRAILSAALRAVRPGGRVVYSTCSLEPEENDQVVAAVLAVHDDARQVSLEPRIASLATAGVLTPSGAVQLRGCLTPEGALHLLPGALPTDGFFVALIEKNP